MNALTGAITAGLEYTSAAPCIGPFQDSGFWRAVGISAAVGAAEGLVSALLPAIGLGFWGTVGLGALTGALGGAAGQLAYNALTGVPTWQNVGQAALGGAIAGALFSTAGYGLGKLAGRLGNWVDGRPGRAGSSPALAGICFEAGTLVATTRGRVPIETIQIGDLVLATDPATGATGHFLSLRPQYRKSCYFMIRESSNLHQWRIFSKCRGDPCLPVGKQAVAHLGQGQALPLPRIIEMIRE